MVGDASGIAGTSGGVAGTSGGTGGTGTAGDTGSGGTGGVSGTGGTGGVVGSCTGSTVAVCDTAEPGARCEEKFCGGRLWLSSRTSFNGYIPYRILDPGGKFSPAYRDAIDASAAAWTRAAKNLVTFARCSPCTGRFISVVPGEGDGIVDPTAWEQMLPMPVKTGASPPLHRIAHQWGHALGLDDAYRRADRSGHARFDPAVWCGTGGPGLPARCAVDPTDEPGAPHFSSGTFGVYDELSKMNGLPTDGVCGSGSPDPDSGEPTLGDASAVAELYFGSGAGWSPFIPVGSSISAAGRRNYELAAGVDPIGAPAIASWTAASVEIFVRGTDRKLYRIQNEVFGTRFVDWTEWMPVGDGFGSDPAAVFAAADTLHVGALSSVDGKIRLRSRVAGTWGDWFTVTGPPVTTTSAPALATADELSLDVLVRGDDGSIYHLACSDPRARCATSASSPAAWTPLPSGPTGAFIGKPSATWAAGWLFVTAVDGARAGWLIAGFPGYWGTWVPIPTDLPPADPDPSIAIAGGETNFFASDRRGLLVNATRAFGAFTLGGILASAPGAASPRDDSRLEVAALIDDHGRRGVWWKFHGGFLPTCVYSAPGTCAQCGCGGPGQPACAY